MRHTGNSFFLSASKRRTEFLNACSFAFYLNETNKKFTMMHIFSFSEETQKEFRMMQSFFWETKQVIGFLLHASSRSIQLHFHWWPLTSLSFHAPHMFLHEYIHQLYERSPSLFLRPAAAPVCKHGGEERGLGDLITCSGWCIIRWTSGGPKIDMVGGSQPLTLHSQSRAVVMLPCNWQ